MLKKLVHKVNNQLPVTLRSQLNNGNVRIPIMTKYLYKQVNYSSVYKGLLECTLYYFDCYRRYFAIVIRRKLQRRQK